MEEAFTVTELEEKADTEAGETLHDLEDIEENDDPGEALAKYDIENVLNTFDNSSQRPQAYKYTLRNRTGAEES